MGVYWLPIFSSMCLTDAAPPGRAVWPARTPAAFAGITTDMTWEHTPRPHRRKAEVVAPRASSALVMGTSRCPSSLETSRLSTGVEWWAVAPAYFAEEGRFQG